MPQLILNHRAEASLKVSAAEHASQAMVHFSTPVAAKVSLQLYDMQGRLLANLYDIQTVAGADYSLPFDISNLKKGAYLLQLKGLSKPLATRLMLQ